MSSLTSCPRCGAGLSDQERIQGLCAGCLLVAGLESNHGEEPASPARRPAPAVEELAAHFPDLELVELVGQGGMGAVYRVRQKQLGRAAALKVLALDADATPAFGERFEREARTLAALDHENIVHVYDAGRAGPWWYLLMEFVDGVSLRQMIRAREVDPRTALAIVAQVCDALQCAHDHGVVHRDIKPENVLVDRRGRVKVLDFGLAKLLGREPRTGTLTETGQVMGTPRYMAPEQWERPLTVDHRADIYSVGVVFYELLTGELPMGAFALPSQKGAPDARVDPVVMKTLAKEPERRYQHASEVRTDVRRIEGTPPPLAPVESAAGDAPVRRRDLKRVVWIAFAVLGCMTLLLVPILAVVFFLGAHDASGGALAQAEQAARAEQRAALETRTRAGGRVDRKRELALAGPAPKIDRARPTVSDWTPAQFDAVDAWLELAWLMNLTRATEELVDVSEDRKTVRFRITTDPETRAAGERLLDAVLGGASSVGLVYDGAAVGSSLSGYSFSGSGYSVVVDAADVLTWWVDGAGPLAAPSRAKPAAFPPNWTGAMLLKLARFDQRPVFDADEWFVTLERGPEPTATLEVAGVRRELTTEELQGTHRVLLSMADQVAPPQPR